MNMRKLFQRINRGIVLAVILLVGLVIYIVVQNAGFEKEKVEIQDMVESYIKETKGMMVLPKEYQKVGQRVPKNILEEKQKENEVLVHQYYYDERVTGSIPAYEEVMNSLDMAYESNNQSGYYVTDFKYERVKVSKLKRKYASGIAVGEIQVKFTVETIGRPSLMIFFDFFHNLEEMESDQEKSTDKGRHTYTETITFYNVIFKKVNGTWKMAASNGYSTDGGSY